MPLSTWALCTALIPLAGPQTDRIDKVFAEYDKPGQPGCAVAIVQRGQPIYIRGFGAANLETGQPITATTPFHIASISKQFTAFAVLLLARERKLSLDDDIRKYLPEMQIAGNVVTIRHLLHHTSGIRDQWDLCVLAGWRMEDVITNADILKLAFRQKDLNFPPGSAFLYSNTGYTLLAEIVSRVSHQLFRVFCKERIFDPLGMTSTRVHDDVLEVIPGRAQSYERTPGGWQNCILSYSNCGATSLFTTVEDFLKWDANLDTAKVGGPAVRDWLLETVKLSSGAPLNYAGGTFVFKYRGLDAVGHSGADAGFRTDCLRFPKEGLSIVVFSNRADCQPSSLTREVADILLADNFPSPKPTPPTPAEGLTLPPSDLDRLVGDYRMPQGIVITVRRSGTKLLARMDGGPPAELVATSPTAFTASVGVKVEFGLPKSGPATKLILLSPRTITAERVHLDWPTGDQLQPYAGRYWSPELEVDYRIELKDGRLVLNHPRDDYPLTMTLPDRFECDLGRLAFRRGFGRRITGFTITTGRVMNLNFERSNRP